jgi:hypothetical protein
VDDIMNTTETRRDRWGRYLVVPPDGSKPEGYTRATTIAKALDDTSSLMAWGERMTAIGMAQRPDLLAQVLDLVDDKTALNKLCERAKEQGGATVRRDLGTALHSILERAFTEPDYTPPPAHVADVAAVMQTLEAHGYRAVAGMHEQIVVCDRIKVAGTFDLLLEKDGRTFIADIKTGSSVTYGALGFAVQLCIYATADAIYRQGAAKDGSEDERLPMPEVDQAEAIIIHVEPGSGQATLHLLHLDPTLLTLALAVRKARTEKGLIEKLEPVETRNMWMRRRVKAAVDVNKQFVAANWPPSVGTPKTVQMWTDSEIDDLIPVMNRVEADLDLPWLEPDPRITAVIAAQPDQIASERAVMPDEGEQQPELAASLRERYSRLSADHTARLGGIVAQAKAAHLPIRVAETPTTRRCRIAEALLHLIEADIDDDHIRSLLVHIIGDVAEIPTVTLGAIIGLLDWQQAQTFAGLTQLIDTHQGETK